MILYEGLPSTLQDKTRDLCYIFIFFPRSTTVFDIQPRPHPTGAGSQHSPILGFPFHLCIHRLSQNFQISRGNTYGERGLFVGVSHAPTSRGRHPSTPQFWRFPSIHMYILCRRTTKFDVVTRGGGLGVSHTDFIFNQLSA